MNRVRPVVLFIYLLSGVFLNGQSQDTVLTKGKIFSLYAPNFMTTAITLDLKNIDLTKDRLTLSLYNGTTNMYDTYVGVGDDHVYGGSTVSFTERGNVMTNLFLGSDSFLESNPLLIQNPVFFPGEDYRVRDSFNPYGATTMGEALFGGFLGLLFN